MDDWVNRLKRHPRIAELFDREGAQGHRADGWSQEEWATNTAGVRRRLDAVLARELGVPTLFAVNLETVGLAEVVYPGLDQMVMPQEIKALVHGHEGADQISAAWPGFLAGVLDTVRIARCITFGSDELDLSAANYPVGKWMSQSTSGGFLVSAMPPRRTPTRRGQFAWAVLVAAGVPTPLADAIHLQMLEAAFLQLVNAARDQALPWLEYDERQAGARVSVPAIRVCFFGLGLRFPRQVYQCSVTGAVWPRSVLGCAPVGGRGRTFVPVDQSALDASPRVGRPRRSYREEEALHVGLWADEHSAQLSSDENRRLQELFAHGIRNVLSATTTMEVGIDIGGLAGVLMANMPPGLANYLQRGGRSGRRSDGASLVITYARRQPYDQAAFDDFGSFFRRELRRSTAMLDREAIVTRHLQAFLLSEFFQAIRPHEAKAGAMEAFGRMGGFCGAPGLNHLPEGYVGLPQVSPPSPLDIGLRRPKEWWDPADEPSLAAAFCRYLAALQTSQPDGVSVGAVRLAEGTAQERAIRSWAAFLEGVSERFHAAVSAWEDANNRIVRAWEAEVESDRARANGRAVLNALARQSRELRKTTVVEELGNRKFLPRYGFPIGLNSLVVNTSREEDQPFKLQRDGAVAIAEYVPGSVIVAGGRYIRSRGVQRGFGENREDTIGLSRWRYVCDDGHSKCDVVMSDPAARCGIEGCNARMKRSPQRLLVPRYGYATATSEPPSWFGERKTVGEVDTFINHLQGNETEEVSNFGNLSGLRATLFENVELLFANPGDDGHGFAVCTVCGYAEGEGTPQVSGMMSLSDRFRRHIPLSRYAGPVCRGATEAAPPLRNLVFAAQQFTDVVRFDLTGLEGVDDAALTTCGHALAQGGAELLELDQREIRMLVDTPREGRRMLRVFDAVGHGSGHIPELFKRGGEWLGATIKVLTRSPSHDRTCLSACITCILSSVSQRDARQGLLDRRAALRVLQGRSSSRLPSSAQDGSGPSDTRKSPQAVLERLKLQRLRPRR